MKTRVRPLHEARIYNWTVEIFDPVSDSWIENSEHHWFWKANLRAYSLARFNLAIKENVKDKFIRRLRDGDEDE